MKISFPSILSLALAAAILSAASCTTGKVYTSWTSSASGFSYSIPETIVKVDIPVKFSRYGTKNDKGFFNPTDGIGYLELDNPTSPLVSFEFDGHPSALNVLVFDEANNTTSLDKFEVTYHVMGADAAQRSTGIIKSVNSEATDKVAATIKNITTTVGDVLKIAAGVSSLLQTTDDGTVLETLLTDRIRVTLKLRSGYTGINAQITEELNRIGKNISRLPTSKDTPLIVGIRSISLDGSCNAWPTKLSQDYVASRMDLDAQQVQESAFVTKNHLNLANGIIYSDPLPSRRLDAKGWKP